MSASSAELPAGVIVLERGWLSSNNILMIGQADAALVDSGYATHAAQTVELVQRALAGRTLDRLLNTHLHSDHCGGNAALQALYSGLHLSVPPGEASAVAEWNEDALSFRATGQVCPRFSFDSLLMPNSEVQLGDRAWQVHAAPGHDPNSIILFEPLTRTLISADALWENGFGIVFPELHGEPSFEQVSTTLDLIERLNPHCVVPGHGRVFVDAQGSLSVARRRLAALAAAPKKHARHAIKVLMKFKLLELQSIELRAWDIWIANTTYFHKIHRRFFSDVDLEDLCAELVAELVQAQAAEVVGGRLQNC